MNWQLQTKDGKPVRFPLETQDFRGDPLTVTGGAPPHHSNSTGRIFTDQGEFFPSVCDLVWVETSDAADANPQTIYVVDPGTGSAYWLAPEVDGGDELFLSCAPMGKDGKPVWEDGVILDMFSLEPTQWPSLMRIEAALRLMLA